MSDNSPHFESQTRLFSCPLSLFRFWCLAVSSRCVRCICFLLRRLRLLLYLPAASTSASVSTSVSVSCTLERERFENFATCNSNPLLISNALCHNCLHLFFEATKHMFVCSFIFLVTETITNLRERENQEETSERERDREIEREEERERGTVNKHTQLMVVVLVDTG